MTYREPDAPQEEIDHEELAFFYVLFRDWQFQTRGGHFPWLTGVVSFVPTFGLSFKGSIPRTSRR